MADGIGFAVRGAEVGGSRVENSTRLRGEKEEKEKGERREEREEREEKRENVCVCKRERKREGRDGERERGGSEVRGGKKWKMAVVEGT